MKSCLPLRERWEIQDRTVLDPRDPEFTNKLLSLILKNRGLSAADDINGFLNPDLEIISPEYVGLELKELNKAIARINDAVKNKERIVIYGDYDADGITSTAILWETLHKMKADVLPFIPDRVEEGYGLSVKGIDNIIKDNPSLSLIITVDNGITAYEAVEYARKKGIEVIITDHHVIDSKIPDAFAVIHTVKMCGAGIAWLFAKEIKKASGSYDGSKDRHLELAALGTVADMVSLLGANRTVVKFGLEKLRKTSRLGLLKLYEAAGIDAKTLGVYDIGFIIGPRLNATGRIENPLDSLRLLCTSNQDRAGDLAIKLEAVNRERQNIMKKTSEHACSCFRADSSLKKILIIAHEEYSEGIIGLVAGKLVEEYYRPSIVISKGEKLSKASARSISGFNIIEFLRSHSEFFIGLGGHPMAAGFTIETEKIIALKDKLENTAHVSLDDSLLTKSLKIDCCLPFSVITKEFFKNLKKLEPFGMGNPEPVFITKDVTVYDLRVLGKEGKHLKLSLKQDDRILDAIAFGMGKASADLKVGDTVQVAYSLNENTWNNRTSLQLRVKDIRPD